MSGDTASFLKGEKVKLNQSWSDVVYDLKQVLLLHQLENLFLLTFFIVSIHIIIQKLNKADNIVYISISNATIISLKSEHIMNIRKRINPV